MLTRKNEWFPEIFNDLFGTNWIPTIKANTTAPAINVIESEKDYVVEVAAPGMNKEDFNIELNEDYNLVIKLEKKTETKSENSDENADSSKTVNEACKPVRRYLRREFSYTKFQQTLVLPDDVEKENISAKMENGVLTINLPKVQPKAEANISRKINIM